MFKTIYKRIAEPTWLNSILKILIGGAITFVGAIFFIYALVHLESAPYIEKEPSKLTPVHTAIVLGSRVRSDGTLSDALKDRVDTAIELYRSSIVETILVSGDDGSIDYNEVNPSRDYMLARGVPSEVIFLDHAGFDTYSSMYRARDVFLVDSVVIVTQAFHLPRAVFIARNLGIDAQGAVADKRTYPLRNTVREVFANIKAVGNIIYHCLPKYLGIEIPITGDPADSI